MTALLAAALAAAPARVREAGDPRGARPAHQVWSYLAQPGWRTFFHGTADAAGNLYWAECGPRGLCDIVSTSADGAVRFRTPVQHSRFWARLERGRLVALQDWVVETMEPGVVRALRSSDGAEVWKHALGPELCGESQATSPAALNLHSITAGRPGEMFVEAHGDPCGVGARRHWVASLSVSTGKLRWSKVFDRSPSELVADESGAVYLRVELLGDDERYRSYLLSLSEAGEERWRTEVSWSARPIAAVQGWLFDSERKVWRASTGQFAFQLPFEPAWGGMRNAFTLADEGSAFVVASPRGGCPGPDCLLRLHRVDLEAKRIEWSVVLAQGDQISITEPILTAQGTVLFAQSDGAQSVLREFSLGGTEIRTEVLPAGHYSGAAVLVGNRWIAASDSPVAQLVAVSAHALPARRGWISWCGDEGCAGRPQEEHPPVAARRPSRR